MEGELVTRGAGVVNGTSKVTLCNLPRYTRQTTVRLCGYVTPGADGSAISSAWFSVDGGAPIPVVPGNGGFVDTSTSLPEGPHTVRLSARSAAGNLTFEERPVTVDVTPPVLEVLTPTSTDVLTSTVVNVASSVSDATPVRVQTQWAQSSTVDSGVGTVTHTVDLVNRGDNTLLVRAIDAVGNTSEVRTRVYFCPSSDSACVAAAHWAPAFVSTSQSTQSVPASGGATLRIEAVDPQASPVTVSWTASIGSLAPSNGASSSEVVWTAPSCVPQDVVATITATATNGLGVSSSHSFQVTGRAGGCAPPPASCPSHLTRYRGQNGTVVTCTCSAAATTSGIVWGTGLYTDDSAVCRAALHAGVISSTGGTIRAVISGGNARYTGSTSNGVTSRSYSSWPGSYSFQ